MKQQIRFCRTFDGVRIAYATLGRGQPLVRVLGWVSHLEHELENPLRRVVCGIPAAPTRAGRHQGWAVRSTARQ